MKRLLPLTLLVPFLSPASAADPPKDNRPAEVTFDYDGLMRDQMKLIADGKGDAALELLEKHAVGPATFADKVKEDFRRNFAAVYGTGGKFVGQEVVGYERLGSRLYRFRGLAYFEKVTVVFNFLLVKNLDGEWKISAYAMTTDATELEKLAPFVPLGKARD